MAGLRDQLLKSGLVSEKQVKQAQKEKVKAQKATGHRAPEKVAIEPGLTEKAQRDRELNQQRQAERARKDIEAQIRQLISTRRIPIAEGETPFNFTDAGKVKKLHLAAPLRDQLIRGIIGIVRLQGKYELVPRETIEKIRQRDAGVIVLLNDQVESSSADDKDPYAQYQIPDDLIW
jgi:uncharacterized protein YaiL (DUF2058 family)